MFLKIVTISLIAFTARIAGGAVWTGLTASWDLIPWNRRYTLPRTLQAAVNEGWTRISGVNEPEGITPLGYQGDTECVLLFGKDGKVSGIQLAFRADELDPEQPLKWETLDVIIPKNLNGKGLYYTSTAYFSENEATNTRKLWFQDKNGLREVPTDTTDLLARTTYKMKNCVPTMGDHYFTWGPSTNCTTLNPWSLLVKKNTVVGLLFHGFGNLVTHGTRKWWENVPSNALDIVVPDAPKCAHDAVATYGFISLHLWFVPQTQFLFCGWFA